MMFQRDWVLTAEVDMTDSPMGWCSLDSGI